MRSCFASLLLLVIGLAGCASQPAAQVPDDRGILYVPSSAVLPAPQRPLNAYAALPGRDDPDFFVARVDKVAYGATSVGGYSAFTTYTTDAQAISTPFGSGYRYRWVVESGYAAPPAP